MNDDARVERIFADGLIDLAPARAPGRLTTDITIATGELRRRPRWLAVMKEPPMRISSTLAVGSPTARVAAIVAATMLIGAAVVGAGLAGSRLLAADGAIVVDQSGGGDFLTITEAVAAAKAGDTILVRPGRYLESVAISELDVTLAGDGERDDIVLEAIETEPILELVASDASISGMTLVGPSSSVVIQGGIPTLTDLRFDRVGGTPSPETVVDGILIDARADATVTDNEFSGGGVIRAFGGATLRFENNDLHDGPFLVLDNVGVGTIIRGNRISEPRSHAIGMFGPGTPVIEMNVVTESDAPALWIGESGYAAYGTDPEIRGNSISTVPFGIVIAQAAAPTIEENEIDVTEYGLSFGGPNTATISGNTICGAKGNVLVPEGMDQPSLDGNELCDIDAAG